MKISQIEYQAILREDFVAFAERAFYLLNPETNYKHNWHIEKIAEALEKCRRGEIKRLIVNVPPRSLKSHLVSICFVAWLLGHNPTKQIINCCYAQDLADKLASDCRSLMCSPWYQQLFPGTRLAGRRQAVHDFATTARGFRLATSVGGVLTGRGADILVVDDPLKPDEALSETQRDAVNDWFDHTLVSRLNDKREGIIIIIMQRLHEDDLVGHVMSQGNWTVLRFPAIAENDETHIIQSPFGRRTVFRRLGEALHPEREPLEVLSQLREVQGEYTFAGQYQQSPAPLGGGLIKSGWFKTYTSAELPDKFDLIFQSWDSANKPGELNDYSVCTTWGVKDKHIFLLQVYRKRFGYPELKRSVIEQMQAFDAKTVLIEDKASGTQLIQEFTSNGIHQVKRYEVKMDKIMRMHSVTNMIENGFVHIPDQSVWLAEYLHELSTFPNGKHDDQVDSTSQALDWFKSSSSSETLGYLDYLKACNKTAVTRENVPEAVPCSSCGGMMTQRIPNGLRCMQCGAQWLNPEAPRPIAAMNRADVFRSERFSLPGTRGWTRRS